MRKKARYEELVAKEVKYEELLKKNKLQERRISTIRSFLDILTRTLGDGEQSRSSLNAMSNLYHDLSSFVFTVNGASQASDSQSDSENYSKNMDRLDDIVRFLISARCGTIAPKEPLYCFENDAMAINKFGVAFGEVKIFIRDDTEELPIARFYTQARFAPGSPKLTSMHWTTLDETNTGQAEKKKVNGDSTETLIGFKPCYPSVVSLDPMQRSDGTKDNSEDGPGMDI